MWLDYYKFLYGERTFCEYSKIFDGLWIVIVINIIGHLIFFIIFFSRDYITLSDIYGEI